MSSVYQIYRSTTIGSTLDDTLTELLHRQIITPRIANYIFQVFDQTIAQKFSSQSNKGKQQSSLFFKAHLESYRACDQVWTLLFHPLTFTSNTDPSSNTIPNEQTNKIKIIACPATNGQQSPANQHHLINNQQNKKNSNLHKHRPTTYSTNLFPHSSSQKMNKARKLRQNTFDEYLLNGRRDILQDQTDLTIKGLFSHLVKIVPIHNRYEVHQLHFISKKIFNENISR